MRIFFVLLLILIVFQCDKQDVQDSDNCETGVSYIEFREIDYDCDGILDSCLTYTYDTNGNILDCKVDDGCDDSFDYCITYTYDENGNKLTEEYDSQCDGTPNQTCNTWTYDTDGNMLTEESDSDCDGTPDSRCYSYTYEKC